MPHRPPQALLFDLGGVLLDIDFDRALQAWAPYSTLSLAELRTVFTHDLPYELHERGDIDATAYFDHLAETLQLSASHAQIEQGWNAIFTGEIEATRRWVESLRGRLPCHAFSNTNASHMAVWSERFPRMVNAFDRICGLTGVPAESFLFFDDLPVNVQAARDAGFQAVLVRSPDDVATALESLGLVRRGA